MELGSIVRFIARIRTRDGYEYVEDSGTVVALYNGGHQFTIADRHTQREMIRSRLSNEEIVVTRHDDRNPRKYELCTITDWFRNGGWVMVG